MLQKYADRTGLNRAESGLQESGGTEVERQDTQSDQRALKMALPVISPSSSNSAASRSSIAGTDKIGTSNCPKRNMYSDEHDMQDTIKEKKRRTFKGNQQNALLDCSDPGDSGAVRVASRESREEWGEEAGGSLRTDLSSPQTNVTVDMSSPITATASAASKSATTRHSHDVDQAQPRSLREWAYDAATGSGEISWFDFGGLTSTRRNGESQELGEEQWPEVDEAVEE
ncbi:hypothetical protein LTS18_001535 [Coniosporium uncinatum]|uniref:Uncharacterized protein n=1 Tax=Coniosporium uncinatum TaxID=93489 RepID=A0ACC3CTK8_9PEZI|nr:hypothetical protein LTS18_001535 [Coniosporium uncinatum]